jgi:hypothetical protein
MIKSLLLIVVFCGTIFGNEILQDQYCKSFINFYQYNPQPFGKLNYPGILADTSGRVAGIGFTNDYSIFSSMRSSTSLNLKNFYFWHNYPTQAGRIGYRVSDINLMASKDESNAIGVSNNRITNANGNSYGCKAGVWYEPLYLRLKGFSLDIYRNITDGESKDSSYLLDTTNNNMYLDRTISVSDEENLSIFENFIFPDGTDAFLKLSMEIGNDKSIVENSNMSDRSQNGVHDLRKRYILTKQSTNKIVLGASHINKVGRIYKLSLMSSVHNNEYHDEDNNVSIFGYDTSVVSAGVEFIYSKTWKFKKINYCADIGTIALLKYGSNYFTTKLINVGSFFDKINAGNLSLSGSVSFPVLLSAKIFNSSYSIFTLVDPYITVADIYSDHHVYSVYHSVRKYKSLYTGINVAAIGIKGTIGKDIDVVFTPAIDNTVLVAGLDLRYSFGRKATQIESED